MSVSRTAAVIFVGWLLMGAGKALAQEPAASFDQLDRQIRPGDTIVVRSTLGAEVRGRLREVGPSSLTVDLDGPRVFGADQVSEVILEQRPSKRRWAGWGFLGGAAIGATLAVVTMDDEDTFIMSRSTAALIMGGIFGGAGALAGAAAAATATTGTAMVYRAPGAAGAPSARLSVAPVVTPRAKGVAVSFAF